MAKLMEIDRVSHIVLAIGLGIGALAIYVSRYSATKQFIVILLIIAFYLTWGFIYHPLRGDASRRLMVEYLIIGSISLLTSFFIFFL